MMLTIVVVTRGGGRVKYRVRAVEPRCGMENGMDGFLGRSTLRGDASQKWEECSLLALQPLSSEKPNVLLLGDAVLDNGNVQDAHLCCDTLGVVLHGE